MLDDDESFMKMESPKTYQGSTSTVTPLLARPMGVKSLATTRVFDSFRSGPTKENAHVPTLGTGEHGRYYDAKAAAWNTANTALVRKLKGRHLQMIAIGGSIGTGLFIGSGAALSAGGPASLLISYIMIGFVLFCTVQALGEMAVTFPVAGSFSAFATRFIDPAVGFAIGWNYALQWVITMPLEVMAAAITLDYWHSPIPGWAAITIFLVVIIAINLFGVRAYGEAEYTFSIIKVTAVIGFIILGIVINCGGGQDTGYIGGEYWHRPGAFHNGFKGFCNILVVAAFSFSGTELVGLAAAETHNPSKALPTAIKQVFWRIALFYVLAIAIVGLLVPYTDSRLIANNSVDSKASPFIIAIKNAGIEGLDSVMNAVVMISVLSVANSSTYAATRTIQALAEQGQAPRFLAYVDRAGRPLSSIGLSFAVGLLAYLYATPYQGTAFTWLLALSGLSSIFTWASICFAHIQFRKAWIQQGNMLSDLVYQSPIGTIGSWLGLGALLFILCAQFWVAIAPIGGAPSARARVTDFFAAYLALPVVLAFYLYYKIAYKTRWVRVEDIDLQTGRNEFESAIVRRQWKEDKSEWPRWKVFYKTLC